MRKTTRRCWPRAASSGCPVFALGAEKSFGKGMADDLSFVASNVTGGIVPNSGHWIMEENPQGHHQVGYGVSWGNNRGHCGRSGRVGPGRAA